jgi:hypothetical protein
MIQALLAFSLLAATPATMVALDNPLVVPLHGAESGSVALFATSGSVIVEVELNNHQINDANVSIVDGDCAHPGGNAYALTDTASGQSVTRIPNTSLPAVVSQKRALVVRRGAKGNTPPIACGDFRTS